MQSRTEGGQFERPCGDAWGLLRPPAAGGRAAGGLRCMGDFVVGESRAAGSRVNGVEGGVPEEGDRVAFEWKFD